MINDNPTFLDRQYGLVVGSARDGLLDPVDSTRYEIKLDCGGGIFFRASLRVRSAPAGAMLAYYTPALATVTKFNIPALAEAGPGYRPLEIGPQVGEGLDYLRDGLFDLDALQAIPQQGDRISLANLVDALVARAVHTDTARIVAFGQAFKDGKADRIFHFQPSWAMHDIHMMQAVPAPDRHGNRNRVYGDGALFFWFPPERELAALFIAFDTQQRRSDQHGDAAAALWQRG